MWYRDFWIPHFSGNYQPNEGHHALQALLQDFGVKQITQNIDGLQPPSDNLIQVHGQVGLFKCCPDEDSDTDDDSDDDDDRPVHLGHRRKARLAARKTQCPYQYHESVESNDVKATSSIVPSCPSCGNYLQPQALLFDEGYHAHSFYDFAKAEQWLDEADCLVFVGTSFAVTLTATALEHVRKRQVPVYNFNLTKAPWMECQNILGPANVLLPRLVDMCKDFQEGDQTLGTTFTPTEQH